MKSLKLNPTNNPSTNPKQQPSNSPTTTMSNSPKHPRSKKKTSTTTKTKPKTPTMTQITPQTHLTTKISTGIHLQNQMMSPCLSQTMILMMIRSMVVGDGGKGVVGIGRRGMKRGFSCMRQIMRILMSNQRGLRILGRKIILLLG